MTVAHELAERGHSVAIYEVKSKPGGFFRSERRENGLPTEDSWHGFGPWYNNTFEIMKRIPFDQNGNVFENALSRPIDFGIFPAHGKASFFKSIKDIKDMFKLSWLEFTRAGYVMLKAWCANYRSQEIYSQIRAVDAWKNVLSQKGLQNWKASFGPWVGSDWSRLSYHTAGQFFCKQMTSTTVHEHPPDTEGGSWKHGKQDGWLLLKGPSSEYWFNRWTRHLKKMGVAFHFETELKSLKAKKGLVQHAHVVESQGAQKKVEADFFILAVNPYFGKKILFESQGMENNQELLQYNGLTQSPGHVQVSFRLSFNETIKFPRKRMAMVLAETEYNLTLFAQEKVWSEGLNLGEEVGSLWTGTACIETVAGRLYGKPVLTCSKEEFLEEVKEQIFQCESLNAEIKKANQGKSLTQFELKEMEIWPEWNFSPTGIKTPWPKWVNNTENQKYLPKQEASIGNLIMAGAHTKTQADVWSIEAAVESGKRAARIIEPQTEVINQTAPAWIHNLRLMDDMCYQRGLPHILTIGVAVTIIGFLSILL